MSCSNLLVAVGTADHSSASRKQPVSTNMAEYRIIHPARAAWCHVGCSAPPIFDRAGSFCSGTVPWCRGVVLCAVVPLVSLLCHLSLTVPAWLVVVLWTCQAVTRVDARVRAVAAYTSSPAQGRRPEG